MSDDLEHMLRVATEAARAGARQLRRPPASQVLKGGDPINVVTDRDLASQRAVFRVLQRAVPDHRLHGEEDDDALPEAERVRGPVWTIDPLDGTSNFAHGHAPFGISVGYARDGQRLVGVIGAPAIGTLAWAVRGRGAFLRRFGRTRRLETSRHDRLDRAMVLTGYGYSRDGYPAWLRRFGRMLEAAQGVRMTGSAVNDLIAVAGGTAEAYWEDELQPWDWAAGALLVEEAGGRVTQMDGRALPARQATFLATNGPLHDDLVRFLAG